MRRELIFVLGIALALAGMVGPAENKAVAEGNWSDSVAAQAQQGEARSIRAEGFTVEVLVNGYPLEQYPARGRVYIEAAAGAEYEIRLHNPLPDRVAVALAVDGLNSIDARHTTARGASKWVIEPYGTITIGGWQMSSARARRFYFTTEQDSYAAKLGRAADVGVITAVFFRERRPVAYIPPPHPLPPLENERQRAGDKDQRAESSAGSARAQNAPQARDRAAAPAPYRDDDYAATGIGRSVANDVRWTYLDLEDSPAATVALRYEYRPALVRLGILPRPYPSPDALQRRERARGFRDNQFCPEP
ncbi:MAG TPA: hypothetical protein VF525_13880 [Pyrinomonadaceae bacterium]|jgi:hypothetical protein